MRRIVEPWGNWLGHFHQEARLVDAEFKALRIAFEELAEITRQLGAHRKQKLDHGSFWIVEFNRLHKEWEEAHATYREANRAFMHAWNDCRLGSPLCRLLAIVPQRAC